MRRGNLQTLRKFYNWNSIWFKTFSYRELILRDNMLNIYLTSIFKRFRFPTSTFKIKHVSFNILMIECDIYVNWIYKLYKYLLDSKHLFIQLYTYLKISLNRSFTYFSTKTDIERSSISNSFFSIWTHNHINNILHNYTPLNYKISQLYFYTNSNSIETSKIYCLYRKNFFILSSFNSKDVSLFSINLMFFSIYVTNLFLYSSNICYFLSSLFFFKENTYSYKLFFLYQQPFIRGSNLFYSEFLSVLCSTHSLNRSYSKLQSFYNSMNDNSLNSSYSEIDSNMKLETFKKYDFFHNFFTFYNYTFLKQSTSFFFSEQFVSNHLVEKSVFKLKYFFFLWRRIRTIKYTPLIYYFLFWYIKFIWNFFFSKIYYFFVRKILINSRISIPELVLHNLLSNIKEISVINRLSFKSNSIFYYLSFKNLFIFKQLHHLFISFGSLNPKIWKLSFRNFFFIEFFNSLILSIEKTFTYYLNLESTVLFIPNLFFRFKPYLLSAKMICDFIYFRLKRKFRISKVYNSLKRWQAKEQSLAFFKFNFYKLNKKIDYNSDEKIEYNRFYRDLVSYRTPLRGLRAICSGPPYKARRKIKVHYHLWVANHSITGNMPLQTIHLCIDYFQSFVILKRATLGLKVWVLFESYVVLK